MMPMFGLQLQLHRFKNRNQSLPNHKELNHDFLKLRLEICMFEKVGLQLVLQLRKLDNVDLSLRNKRIENTLLLLDFQLKQSYSSHRSNNVFSVRKIRNGTTLT